MLRLKHDTASLLGIMALRHGCQRLQVQTTKQMLLVKKKVQVRSYSRFFPPEVFNSRPK